MFLWDHGVTLKPECSCIVCHLVGFNSIWFTVCPWLLPLHIDSWLVAFAVAFLLAIFAVVATLAAVAIVGGAAVVVALVDKHR